MGVKFPQLWKICPIGQKFPNWGTLKCEKFYTKLCCQLATNSPTGGKVVQLDSLQMLTFLQVCELLSNCRQIPDYSTSLLFQRRQLDNTFALLGRLWAENHFHAAPMVGVIAADDGTKRTVLRFSEQ